MHKCEYPECVHMVESARLFCGRHWAKVPKPLKDAVWATYMARRRMALRPGYEDAKLAHQRAKVDAIRALDEQQDAIRDYDALLQEVA